VVFTGCQGDLLDLVLDANAGAGAVSASPSPSKSPGTHQSPLSLVCGRRLHRMLMRGLLALTVVGAVAWAITQARDSRPAIAIGSGCGDSAAISLTPATPTLGALFRVRVSGASPEAHLAGVVAGEPLHFHADSAGGSQESLAPVPIDSPDSLLIVVRCTMNGASDSLVAHVRTGSGNYPVERLRGEQERRDLRRRGDL